MLLRELSVFVLIIHVHAIIIMTTNHHAYAYTYNASTNKGLSDWRKYRTLTLSNGIQVALVQEQQQQQHEHNINDTSNTNNIHIHTACSVCINTGASSDPRNLSGLAHFVEHMCFLGSEKYPIENAYKKYLASHGGRSNASTSMGQTVFQFEVLAEFAEDAVDIFSQFFVCPLLDQADTVNREVNAVDSENSRNMATDGRRGLQILKALADPDHHYSKFSTGNGRTLPVNDNDNDSSSCFTREALLAFHRKHYRPDNMSVVIVGPQDLDTLEEWIVSRFEQMKPHNTYTDEHRDNMSEAEQLIEDAAKDAPGGWIYGETPPPFRPAYKPEFQPGGKWPVMLTTNPLKDIRSLTMYFPLPPVHASEIHERCPVNILAHLIGHEGSGSPFAVLQDRGLITGLQAGSRISAPDQTLMSVKISLTNEGERRWEEVVKVIFEYCSVIRDTVSQAVVHKDPKALTQMEYIWDEIIQLKRLKFNTNPPGSPYKFAQSLSRGLLFYGPENCISCGYSLNEDKASVPLDLLNDFLERLAPENCFLERCSNVAWKEAIEKSYDEHTGFGVLKEQWYNIDYHVAPIEENISNSWLIAKNFANHDLFLPRPNAYIPKIEELVLSDELPDEAKDGPRIELPVTPPNLVISNNNGRLWHRLDNRYALPKSSLTLLMRCRTTEHRFDEDTGSWYFNAESVSASNLIVSAFASAMAQETYDAHLAGLGWSLIATHDGLELSCAGFSPKLTHLALRLLVAFVTESDNFLVEKFVEPVKDRKLRTLRSYFNSARADELAGYYSSMLSKMRGDGIDQVIEATESISIDSLKTQHQRTLKDITFECLYSGNVGESEAKYFYSSACGILESSTRCKEIKLINQNWTPGTIERRLHPGEDIHLHFTGQNQEDENGALVMKFQSPIPGFKGSSIDNHAGMSSHESLYQSATLRLLSHMLREPFFNELRTKQQLGYVVSSSYGLTFSHESGVNDQPCDTITPFGATPVEYINLNILSRKLSPDDIQKRVDNFLHYFGSEYLTSVPQSEIDAHAASLSKKMLKPLQNLGTEANLHFTKIKRYAPEILHNDNLSAADLPWNSIEELATAVTKITREDLIQVWSSVVTRKSTRARIVSHIYGTTFPISATKTKAGSSSNAIQINNVEDLLKKRNKLKVFRQNQNDSVLSNLKKYQGSFWNSAMRCISKPINGLPKNVKLTLFGMGFVGIGGMIIERFFGGKKIGESKRNDN